MAYILKAPASRGGRGSRRAPPPARGCWPGCVAVESRFMPRFITPETRLRNRLGTLIIPPGRYYRIYARSIMAKLSQDWPGQAKSSQEEPGLPAGISGGYRAGGGVSTDASHDCFPSFELSLTLFDDTHSRFPIVCLIHTPPGLMVVTSALVTISLR